MLTTAPQAVTSATASDAAPAAVAAVAASGAAETFARADHAHAVGAAVSASDLASTATGKGASLVGLEDAAGNFDATNIEAVILEMALGFGPTVDVAAAAVPRASVQTGTVVLVAGSATGIAATLTAGSVVIPMREVPGGSPGALSIANQTVGAPGSFDIASANGGDTATIRWLVIG